MTTPKDTDPSAPDGTTGFQISVASGRLAAREATTAVLDRLADLSLDREEIATIELVLAEIINNIVEHAYPESGAGGPIDIACRHTSRGLIVEICDEGRAMPDGPLPQGNPGASEVALEDTPEGGFGWFLIQHLAKDVTYRRERGKNHLSVRLAIGLAPRAPC